MYAYWYEDGQLMAYEGTKGHFSMNFGNHTYYIYGFTYSPDEWFKSVMINGINSICSVFAEDVPSEIRAMHLLLVKE